MMYDGKTLPNRNACPKCGNPLGSIYTKKGRAMAISEGTIYPTMTETEKAQDAENTAKRKNAMLITHRFVLFSFADPKTGILQEPPVHQYLATGREVMLKVGHGPIASWYKAKDNTVKLELRHVIMYGRGDKIQLLGPKKVAGQPAAQVIPPQNIGVMAPIPQTDQNTTATMTAQVSAEDANTIATLEAQIAALTIRQNAGQNQEPLVMEKSSEQTLFSTDEDPFDA